MTQPQWPVADFDPVRRLRVIAATTPGVALHERVIDAPFGSVWAVAADLEGELPQWVFPDIRSVRLIHREGSRSEARVLGHTGLRARFDVVLEPGWCLMQSRFLLGGIAAAPESGATRVAVLAGVRGAMRILTPLSAPAGRRALSRLAKRIDQRSAGATDAP